MKKATNYTLPDHNLESFKSLPEQYQKDILNLVETMAFKLNKNRNKACSIMNPEGKDRSYYYLDPIWCIDRAIEEAEEAREALLLNDLSEAKLEAGDIANFAMFLHYTILTKQEEVMKNYRKKGVQPMRPYVNGESLEGISVSPEDKLLPTLEGGMIAVNKNNPEDKWYVAKKFFEENYEEA